MHAKWIVSGLILTVWWLLTAEGFGDARPAVTSGELRIVDASGNPAGACPLKHTDVEADIVGFISRVRVRQVFHNPLDAKIEAVYVFPLPQNAAVDAMLMIVGDRRIVGQIKPRDEARAIYRAARAAGHVASLLDQERPNIFTQSVTNIEPGAQVVVELSYVETLPYADGVFEFVFPMVVGPRYMPGTPTGAQGTGWAPDTTGVPDASRISPPVTPPGTRAGHDIKVTVRIDAGLELHELESVLHAVVVGRTGTGKATVTLQNEAEIPNKDFILRYRTATSEISDTFLTHTDERGTFFTLIVQPPRQVLPERAMPKELIFVIDRSGSMSGFPIEKAKETMRQIIAQMNPRDTFNLLSFSGGTGRSFSRPVPNTPQNRAIALKYLADLYGSGGTEMMPAIREALGEPYDPKRLRIVAFMTDGYIGNDFEIIDAVRQHAGTTRVFAFGIGNAVNRFLLDGMASAGRGAVEYVTLQGHADDAAQRFAGRIQAPVLTDIDIDWGTLPVMDVYPQRIPDLFSSTPIMIHGRLQAAAEGTMVLRGNTAAGPFERPIHLRMPSHPIQHDAVASLWARAKVAGLLLQDYGAVQRGTMPEALRKAITALAVEFHLATQFTSFVAVEEMLVTLGGQPTLVAVPVEMPEGVSYEGVFGQGFQAASSRLRSGMAFESIGVISRGVASPPAMRRDQAAKVVLPSPAPARDELAKLAEPLRALGEKVAKAGKGGTLTVDKLRVIDYRVDVLIYLDNTSAGTIAALKELGFVQTGESKVARLLIGSIDVRKLGELAKLEAVIRVTPVVS